MRHAVSRELHERWDALRGDRPVPERGDVDPGAIRGVLASAFVLEVPRPARFGGVRGTAILSSGTRIDALFDRPLRGESFDRIWSVPSRDRIAAMLDGVVQDHLATVASARGGPAGGDEAAFELVLLPLGPAGWDRWRVLGSLAALSRPDWIGQKPTMPLDVSRCRALRRHGAPNAPGGTDPVRVGRFTVHPGGRDRRTPVAAFP